MGRRERKRKSLKRRKEKVITNKYYSCHVPFKKRQTALKYAGLITFPTQLARHYHDGFPSTDWEILCYSITTVFACLYA